PHLPRSTLFPYTTLFRSLFFCMGHGRSRSLMEEHRFDKNTRIVDLSHDFRIRNGHDFIYGLPELQRELIRPTRRVANPGCFATRSEEHTSELQSRENLVC